MTSPAPGVKGMVLAAGFGTRLRPLTERWPKPLLPFAGTTPLELALWRLGEAGIDDIAVNSHHLPEMVAAFVAKNAFGQRLRLSHEPEILGTGGCYNPLRSWVGGDDLVVINGDVVSTIDVGAAVARHREAQAVATMVLLPAVIPGESAVFHQEGKVLGFGKGAAPAGAAAGNFACVQVLSPRFLDLLPRAGVFDVISAGYKVALAQGLPVAAALYDGIWHDLRSPAFVWAALKDLLDRPGALAAVGVLDCLARSGGSARLAGGTFQAESAAVATSVTLSGHVVIEPGARVGAGARLDEAWLLPGAEVVPGEIVAREIRGPGLRVALA